MVIADAPVLVRLWDTDLVVPTCTLPKSRADALCANMAGAVAAVAVPNREAVNEELRDLKAAGADVVQIDEPYLQARSEPAREYAVEAIDRALDGIGGDTVLHTCFGYAHIVHDRPSGYPFLRELNECLATHVSLEAAQPNLDPEVLQGHARPS